MLANVHDPILLESDVANLSESGIGFCVGNPKLNRGANFHKSLSTQLTSKSAQTRPRIVNLQASE